MSKPKKRVFSGVADPEAAQPILQYQRELAEFTHVPGRYIERSPLRFDGKGASSLNYSRLPVARQRAKMEMAFREEPLSDTLLLEYADRRLMAFIALVAAIGFVFGSAFPLIDPFLIPYLLPGAVFLGFGAAFFQVLSRGFRGTNRLLLIMFLPPAAILLLKLLSLLIQWRLPASAALTVATFFAIHRFGHRFFDFYNDWLLTEPALTPENRKELRGKKTLCSPDYLVAVSVFGAAVILPWLSPTIAFLSVTGIFVTFILRYARELFGRYRLTGLLIQVRQMLGIYLSYGESTTLAPGVWVPRFDVAKRKLQFAIVVGLTAFTFTVALQGYFPWDIPFLFRQDFLEAGTKELLAETHGWTRVALAAAFEGDTRFVWCFPFALIFSLAVPALSLFLIFLPTLVAAADRRELIYSAANRDRPEWQWYVDRLRSSEHEAKDPLQHTVVREKAYLFLGIDPVAHHPVLLDRKILAEHVYIVGESGSGKTSLGIMPLLVQLIRGDSAGVMPKRLDTHVNDIVETTITCPNCKEVLETSGTPRVQEFECPSCNNDFAVNLSVAAMPRNEDPHPPMVILDLKGDPALFHTVRAEAEARCPGSFRWFTPEKGSSSHCFNPFLDFSTDSRTMVQVRAIAP